MHTFKTFIIAFLCILVCPSFGAESDTIMSKTLKPTIPKDPLQSILFTTERYQEEAFRLVLAEANLVSRELGVDEKLPIRKEDVRSAFISPYGFAIKEGEIGWIGTSNYSYGVERSNMFSDLDITDSVRVCNEYRRNFRIPMGRLDYKAASVFAIRSLEMVSMDIKALNRDCSIKVEVSRYWNDLGDGGLTKETTFVPIYDVLWFSKENQASGGDVAYVQVFLPTKKLLQLHVHDPKYILRKPLKFTNLVDLLSQTNNAQSKNGAPARSY